VRIEGCFAKIHEDESANYFNSRPEESQISSIISPQSEIIPTRNFLEKLWDDYVDMHKNNAHERPTFWGGYKLMPTYFEFWQGRVNRLHDRIIYEQTETGWNTYRLAP